MRPLLEKYAGGRIPPLVAPPGQPVERGLLVEDFVKLFQRGFSITYSIPLGMLVANEAWEPIETKWARANYSLNTYMKPDWTPFCAAIREVPAGNAECEACDRRFAVKAEQAGDVIAYLCSHGMVDFAVPVFVNGTAVAILLTGQRKPKPGTLWSPAFLEDGGPFQGTQEGESGQEAWAVSKRRIAETEIRLGMRRGQLASKVRAARGVFGEVDASPADVQAIMDALRGAGRHLSQLASATFELEKAKIVAWIRGKVAESLRALTGDAPRFDKFWDSISSALDLVARYFRFDYALVVSCKRDPSPHMTLVAYAPKDKRPQSPVDGVSLEMGQFRSLMEKASSSPELVPIDPGGLGPHLTAVTTTPAEQLGLKNAVVVPANYSPTSATFAVMGGRSGGFSIRDMTNIDRQAFKDLVAALSMVVKVARLVEDLQCEVARHASFLLDVAHDIRNPIQNIVLKAERLRRGLFRAEDLVYHVRRIGAQARRLSLLSERAWALEQIERGTFKVDKVGQVQIYAVLKECADSLMDLATLRSVTISIGPELQNWPVMRIDKGFLTQALLNLLDNAIKYSRRQTEVRIHGKHDNEARYISVVNQGAPIMPDEYEKIFEKFYKTPAAQAWIVEGVGVGLSIVKMFADTYGAVTVRSQPVVGTRDYVTEFVLKIKKEGTEYV